MPRKPKPARELAARALCRMARNPEDSTFEGRPMAPPPTRRSTPRRAQTTIHVGGSSAHAEIDPDRMKVAADIARPTASVPPAFVG
jgi:hypothetical protein